MLDAWVARHAGVERDDRVVRLFLRRKRLAGPEGVVGNQQPAGPEAR
jgi:hypothetical protein